MSKQVRVIEPDQKALEINLNASIYGTFSEIGAGQEVARHFFQVGAAAGTIAKTMSAYDKTYSDEIYGVEESGRYVCEARLYKMLDHEYGLLIERLDNTRPESKFFAFADTVSAINFHRTIKGNGWLGVRFQAHPNAPSNDIVLQVRMLDHTNVLQQQAVGILGVNMVYACYHYTHDIELFLQSLVDTIKDRVFIDMVRLTGPVFEDIPPRLLPLLLVKNDICDVSMFNQEGNPVHASEFLYKKEILVVRGKYRPCTLRNEDMHIKSMQQFEKNMLPKSRGMEVLTEINLEDLKNQAGQIEYQDYLDRTAILCKLGRTVIITKDKYHPRLVEYLSEQKFTRLSISIWVRQLVEIIQETYDKYADDRIIAAFGELFTRKLNILVYPYTDKVSGNVLKANNIPIQPAIKFLYQHMMDNDQIKDIEEFNESTLALESEDVYELVKNGNTGWENSVSDTVRDFIKQENLFGYPVQQYEFEY